MRVANRQGIRKLERERHILNSLFFIDVGKRHCKPVTFNLTDPISSYYYQKINNLIGLGVNVLSGLSGQSTGQPRTLQLS
jgi:hypothetical protein